MKNNKGFTLVELIGVIVLLALITVLVVPNVIKLISKNEKNSFEESVKGLIRAVQDNYASSDDDFPITGLNVEDITFEVSNIDKFVSGKIINENGTYSVVNVTDGKYYANGKRNSLSITEESMPEYQIDYYDFNNFANWRTGQYSMTTGAYQTYNGRIALIDYITCKPSTTYKVSVNKSKYNFVIRLMNSDKGFVKSVGGVGNGNTFTTTADTAYAAIGFYNYESSPTFAQYQQLFADGLVLSIDEQ